MISARLQDEANDSTGGSGDADSEGGSADDDDGDSDDEEHGSAGNFVPPGMNEVF